MEIDRDFSKYTNAEYNDFVLNKVYHPICRCVIISWGYFDITKNLVREYKEECNKKYLWIN